MGRTGTRRIIIKKEGFELELEQHENHHQVTVHEMDESALHHEMAFPRANLTLRGKEPQRAQSPAAEEPEEVVGVYVSSPMVGTFYSSPSPEDPHFVKVGDRVEKHTVICIIEAMKVMNEVKAGVAGTVAEVLVENGQPVEFGTKLFRITS